MAELFNPYTNLVYNNIPLQVRLRIYEPDGVTTRGFVGNAFSMQTYDRIGQTPTLSVSWTEAAGGHELLAGPCIVAAELLTTYEDGTANPRSAFREFRNLRFVIHNDAWNRSDEKVTHDMQGVGVINLFSGSVVWNNDLDDEGRRVFTDATAGSIVQTLVNEAKSRGELPAISLGFSATHDSFGQPWQVTNRSYEPSTDLQTIISNMLDSGLAEYWMDGMTLHMATPGSWDSHMMADPYRPYIRQVMQPSAPESVSWADMASNVLLIGDEDYTYTRSITPSTLDMPFGPRSMVVKAGGVSTDEDAARIVNQELLSRGMASTTYTREWTYTGDGLTQYMPYRNFSTGDWIDVDIEGATRSRMQVQEMSLTRGTDGALKAFVSVGTIRDDLLTRMARQQRALTDGAVVASTGAPKQRTGETIIEGGTEFDAYPGEERGLKLTEDAGGLKAYGGVASPHDPEGLDFIKTHTSAEIDKDDGRVSLGGAVRTTDTDLVFKGSNYDELKADPSYVEPGGTRGNANTGDGSRVVMASQTSGGRPSDSSVIVEGDNASMTARHEVNQNPLITRQTDLVVTPNGVEINTNHRGGVVTGTDLTVGTVDVTRRLDLEDVELVTNHTAWGRPPRFRNALPDSGLSIGQDSSGKILGTDAEGYLKALRSRDFISRAEVEQLVDGRIDSIPTPVPEDGVGIVDITIVDERRFRIHLSNNTSYTVTMPLGPEGPPGPGMTEARVRQIISEYLDGGGGTGPGEPEPDPDLPTVVIGSDARGSLHDALDERGLDYRTVTEIPFNLDIQASNLYRLFYDMAALRTAPAMNTSGVTNMQQMFYGCSSLTYIPDMDTSGVTSMGSMLRNTASLQDGYVRLIGMHPNLGPSSRLSMISGSALTREPFFDTEGNPIP